jgi:hypothetical protein
MSFLASEDFENYTLLVRFQQIHTALTMKNVFWDTLPYSPVELATCLLCLH